MGVGWDFPLFAWNIVRQKSVRCTSPNDVQGWPMSNTHEGVAFYGSLRTLSVAMKEKGGRRVSRFCEGSFWRPRVVLLKTGTLHPRQGGNA